MKKDQHPVPLAIVGMACRFPKADGFEAYWANILNGVDCITEVPKSHWNPDDYFNEDKNAPDMTYSRKGGFLDPVPFNPLEFGIPPTSIEATDTSQLLGMVVAKEALEDAGYGEGRGFDRDRVSVILGVTGALELVIPLGARLGHPIWRKALKEAGLDDAKTEAIVQKISDSYVPWKESSFPGLLGNVVAGRIANSLDLGGSNCVVDAACASALSALHLASMELWSGRSDMVLTGGIDTFNDIFMYMCFSKTPALSPGGHARPFDSQGDGTTLGEGVGVVALKRLDDAERDGDQIYAVIRGMGSSSDGKGNAIYAPNSAGQAKALRRAYEHAGVTPDTVELVEGHGTGTKVGDGVEVRALSEVYRDSGKPGSWCAVGSVKSQIGHAKAAAGVAGLMKAALSLKNKVLPPSIKVDTPLDSLRGDSPFYLSPQARPWMGVENHPRRAAVSAFGFGGSNYHCVLEEYGAQSQAIAWDSRVEIIAFCGPDHKAIETQLTQLGQLSEWAEVASFAAGTRLEFQVESKCRLLILAEKDKFNGPHLMARAQTLLASNKDRESWDAPEGIYYGSGPKRGKLGVLFPGQGSQYPGMLRDLACRFPQMQNVLQDVDKAFAREFGEGSRLTDLIYPKPAYADGEQEAWEHELRRTQHAQPAIGAVSIGALKVLNYFGVQPEAAAGHSYGEITALCASQRFDTEALYLLSLLRGKLMAEGDGDRGAMAAVRAPLDRVQALVTENNLDLVLANKNAPDQVVLSGPSSEIHKAVALLEEKQISNKLLPVAAAFHSTLVAQASKPFAAELRKIDFPKSRVPVYSNTTAGPYPEAPQEARDLLASQLTQPVEFVDEITNMYEDGVRTYLEIGPGARLTGLIKSILSGKDFQALAVDSSSGKRPGHADLARVLAQLAANGHAVDLGLWEESKNKVNQPKPRKGLIIPLTGANYMDPKTKEKAEAKMNLPVAAPVSEAAVSKTPVGRQSKPEPRVAPKPAREATSAVQNAPQTPVSGRAADEALQMTAQHMLRLQKMQEETANLHRLFLEGQDTVQQQMQMLMQQQQQILSGNFQPHVAPIQNIQQPVAPKVSAPQPPQPAPAAPVAEVKPAPAPEPAPAPQPDGRLAETLLAVVAEKTGYPVDMLDLGMSLDADLGIDSIKRVEIMSSLQEAAPHAPVLDPETAGRLQTLGDIVTALGSDAPQGSAPVVSSGFDPGLLLEVVADKTGYPVDMLDLEMSLDADLGIDSIKRVEIFSTLQERLVGAPEIKPDEIARFNTLGEIAIFLGASSEPTQIETTGPAVDQIQKCLLQVVAEKTGYPEDMLDLGMSLDADLGIDSIKRVEILSGLQEMLPDLPAVEPGEMGELKTLGDIVARLGQNAPTSEPVTTAGVDESRVQKELISVISEKTGYPEDMLTPEMHLESDLGIDSIKRVEIFSALSEAMPELPEMKPDQLGAFGTVGEIVAYLGQSDQPIAVGGKQAAPHSQELAQTLLSVVADKTGYPADMLSLEMGLESDLGIDSIKRVEILSGLQDAMPNLPEIKPDEAGSLQTLQDIVDRLSGDSSVAPKPVAQPVVANEATLSEDMLQRYLVKAEPLDLPTSSLNLSRDGLIWLAGDGTAFCKALAGELEKRDFNVRVVDVANRDLVVPDELNGLVILAPNHQNSGDFLKHALMLTQRAGSALRKNGPSLLAGVTRLDGHFGFADLSQDSDPIPGGLAGLVKTAGREWSEIKAKALDLAPEVDNTQLVAQLLLSQTPVEVGLDEAGARYLTLSPSNVERGGAPVLEAGDVVLATGGARGVTAETCIALAEKFQPTLVLMGRSPEPEAQEPEWLLGLTNEAAIKKELMGRMEGKPNPKELQKAYQNLMAARDIRRNMQLMRDGGSKVVYRTCDFRNTEAISQTTAEIRDEFGSIKGLIYGAGVLADRLIEDKTEAQFDLVFDTKAKGAQALLDALKEDDLKAIVLFSSSTARFGRTGQVDYAMANEALNKMAQVQQRLRPKCRVLSANWGPWDGGMVNASLKKVFASEGIGLVGRKAGAQYLVDELYSSSGPVETVVVGLVNGQPLPEGFLRPEPAIEVKTIKTDLQCAFDINLSVQEFPFLESHVLDGKAVLPTVLMIEWLGHAASHMNPGYKVQGFKDLRILKGVILDAGARVVVSLHSGMGEQDGDHVVVEAQLRSEDNGKMRIHASAQILLGTGFANPQPLPRLLTGKHWNLSKDEIYQTLFHGPHFQGIEGVDGVSEDGITVSTTGAPLPKEWISKPLRGSWYTDPLAIDCAFQAMVLWGVKKYGLPSLPVSIKAFHQFSRFPGAGKPVEVTAVVREYNERKAVADIAFIDPTNGKAIARLDGYECIIDASLQQAYSRKQLLTGAV